MQLRDYQTEAVEFLVARPRAFVQAPAGSGKTIIAAAALVRVTRRGMRVGWLANTKEQVDQAIAAISTFFPGPTGIDFDVCCAASEPDFTDKDVVVVDESHHTPARTWFNAIRSTRAILWGFSATPFGDDPERNAILREVFQEFLTIDRARVEASGHVERGKVYMHDLDTPHEFDAEINRLVEAETARRSRRFRMVSAHEHARRVRWQITQEFIQANERRNQWAVALAQNEAAAGESVLLLVHSIEHGEKLAERIGPVAAVCHSKLSKGIRNGLITDFRSGQRRVLCATSLADEGLDVPRASRLVLVAGGRSAGKLEQRAGRVLRPFAGKNGGIIHDFLDAGCMFALAQAKARFKVYRRLGYSPEIVTPAHSPHLWPPD